MRTLTPRPAARINARIDRPIGQNVGGNIDVVLSPIDQRDIGLLQIFDRRIVNDRRWIGEAPQERDKH